MKGDISAAGAIIYTFIGLAILLMFIVAISPKHQAENTYLGQPGGITLTLAFEKEFEKFVSSPEKKMASLGGKSTIQEWEVVLTTSKETVRSLMPTAVMYPLVIGGTQTCPVSSDEPTPFGRATLEMNIDLSKLDSYFKETYQEGFGPDKITSSTPESDLKDLLKNIWIKICWDNGKQCYECDPEDLVCMNGEGMVLDELKKDGTCIEDTTLPEKPLKCSFNLDPLVEKCCPSSLDIETNITTEVKAESGKGISKKRTIATIPLRPTLIYYVDPSDKTNLISSCFKTPEGEKKNPIEDISIYPCRAIVRSENALKELSTKITGPKEEPINFEDCISGSGTIVDGYTLISPEFGWMCKKVIDSDQYYLLNPYAFCKLDGKDLPSSPQVGYLQTRFPSGGSQVLFVTTSTELAWAKAKEAIDIKYKIIPAPVKTTPLENPEGQNPPVITPKPTEPKAESPETPPQPEKEIWKVSKCGDKCHQDRGCGAGRLTPDSFLVEVSANSVAESICKHPFIIYGPNALCNIESNECVLTLKLEGGIKEVQCTCPGQSAS